MEIRTDFDFETALKQLEKIEDDWWLDNMPTNGYSLLTDVMFAYNVRVENAKLLMNFNK